MKTSKKVGEYVHLPSVEDLYDHEPRRGRPRKPKGRPGPKPKNELSELAHMENVLRDALGMAAMKNPPKDKETPEEQEAHKSFIQSQMLHAARLAVIWVTGCIAGKWHVEAERGKLATASINHAIGTPVQKLSVVGESQETLDYIEKLKKLRYQEESSVEEESSEAEAIQLEESV